MKRPFSGISGMYPITQEWGVNSVDYKKFGLYGHNGVDYGTPLNTPILAPHSGKVIEAAFDQYGYGMYIKIENDVEGSVLAHFTSFNVNAGDTVSEGQQVGLSGNTGNSTGPHLHWGYYRMPRNKNDGYSGTTNPFPYLSENGTPSNPTIPQTDCEKALSDAKILEKQLRDAIRSKDNAVKTFYLGLPNADKSITDFNQQMRFISDTFLNLNKTLFSTQQDALIVAEDLKKCQSTSNSSTKLQDKLNKLQTKYNKLLKMPSKAQLDLLIKICNKLEISNE